MAGTITVSGLASGLDTENIINQLVAIQTNRVARLEEKQAEQTSLISLFQALQANYLSLRTAADTLKSKSLFEKKTATSSDTDILTASATDSAVLGSTQFTVKQLAKKSQFVSNRFSDTDATTLGSGTLKITVGSGASAVTTDITIDSSNHTLQGITDAINNSGAKVTASILKVDDSTAPYQLLVTADEAGEANAITITHDASIKTTVTGEILGVGAATATQDTDDSDAKTYALRHLPNPGTVTVKVNGTTVDEEIEPTVTALETGGTLPAGVQHFYIISALDGSGEIIRSAIVNTTTLTGNGFAADNSNQIQFNDVNGAVSYNVYRVDETEDIGTAGIDINDFTGQNSLIANVADDGSSAFTFTDTGQVQAAPPASLSTITEGDYTLDESTGAITFQTDQTLQVTADYEYDLEFLQSEAAQDAIIELGSGANVVTVRKSTNEISDLIEGVTLSLKKADAASTVLIDVKRSTLGVSSAVQSFVDAINVVEGFIEENSFFDPETNATGDLFGDPNVLNIRARVTSILNGQVKSLASGKLRALSQIGVTLNPETGSYSLDSSKLSEVLAEKPDEVRDLFASVGIADDPDIEVLAFTENTVTSSSLGYLVQITQAATRPEREGAQDISGGLTVDETLTITVGASEATVALQSGTAALAAVSEINTALENAGISKVRATYDSSNGKITIRHDEYGSGASFKLTSDVASGTAGSTGLGASTSGSVLTFTGKDVKGTINGEAATGSGQVLTGNSGNATTDGLQIKVTLTPSALAAQGSSQGSAVVSRGIATQLEEFLSFLTDETQEGPIQAAIDEADDRIQDLKEQIDAVNARAERERERLQREFTALEQAIGQLQTTSTFLDSQLRQIQATSEAIAARSARRR